MNLSPHRKRFAISRGASVGIVVVLIIVAGIGVAFYATTSHPTSSTSSTTSMSSRGTTTSSITSSQTSSVSGPQTLVIDELNWPIDDMNVLYWPEELPWPQWYAFAVYQPLVDTNLEAQYGNGTIQFEPGLAANWTVNSDSTVYTFNLRQGVKFSNGDPFNAYQYWMEMYGFYYLSGNSSSWLESYNIFDMSNVNFGPATIAQINESGLISPSAQAMAIMQNQNWPIYVTGPYQIVFHLSAPFNYFLGIMVAYAGNVFDTQFVLDHGGFGTPASFNTYFNQHSIPGTGPYVVSGFLENSYIKFTQNQNYWGKNLSPAVIATNQVLDPGHVKTAIVYYKSDDLARFSDLSTGAAQIADIESQDWPIIRANPSTYSYVQFPDWTAAIAAVSLNVNLYPTNITLVRQAIVHSINYTDVAQKAFEGQLTRGMGPEYPAWKQFYDLGNYPPYEYNTTLAAQDLASAGFENGNGLPAITFRTVAGCTYCSNVAQVVQADLADIGITVNIEVLASNAYWGPYGSTATNVADADQLGHLSLLGGESWSPAALTPADYWIGFVNNASLWGNWAGYSNPTVQACVNAFTSSSDVAHIQSLCQDAQKQIYNDAPYAWLGFPKLWFYDGSIVWKTGVVKNFYLDPVWNGMTTTPIINTVTFG